MAWNLKGAITWTDYLAMTAFDRTVLCYELNERITEHNDSIDD